MKKIISVQAFFISGRRHYYWRKSRVTRTLETNNKQYFPLELQVIQTQIP